MTYMFPTLPTIHAPEHGDGTPVVLLHGSASTSGQWRSLVDYLSGRCRLITPDLPGYGKSAEIVTAGPVTLEHFAQALRPLIDAQGQPVHLVGHSFGGAVALKIAAMFPASVASLTLIEPAAFGMIRDQLDKTDFMKAVRNSRMAMAEGDVWSGTRHFMDFWNGAGSFDRTSHGLCQKLAAMLPVVHRDFEALDSDPFCAWDAAGVVCPVLLVRGDSSPAEMDLITAALQESLPFVRTEVVEDAGHLVPLSDPHIIDPMIGDFVAKIDLEWQDRAKAA